MLLLWMKFIIGWFDLHTYFVWSNSLNCYMTAYMVHTECIELISTARLRSYELLCKIELLLYICLYICQEHTAPRTDGMYMTSSLQSGFGVLYDLQQGDSVHQPSSSSVPEKTSEPPKHLLSDHINRAQPNRIQSEIVKDARNREIMLNKNYLTRPYLQ